MTARDPSEDPRKPLNDAAGPLWEAYHALMAACCALDATRPPDAP